MDIPFYQGLAGNHEIDWQVVREYRSAHGGSIDKDISSWISADRNSAFSLHIDGELFSLENLQDPGEQEESGNPEDAEEPSKPDVATDIRLDPVYFSPNDDGEKDTTDIRFRINEPTEYFSLDVYTLEGMNWAGTIVEFHSGMSIGGYTIREWDGTVTDLDEIKLLPEGPYVIIPFYGTVDNLRPIINQQSPFVVDVSAPDSQLDRPPIMVDEDAVTISGRIICDLLIEVLGDYSAVEVYGQYEDNGPVRVDGSINNEDGRFFIKAPILSSINRFEIFAADAAGNGTLAPAFIFDFSKGKANLWERISEAHTLLADTREGNDPGQYPAASRAALAAAIDDAEAVAYNSSTDEAEVARAESELASALAEYAAAKVPEAEKAGLLE
ncbi:hypothetical protein, partial [Paenibacillus senegalensis]|uniref:hypothetical protein n=1 Tax=Paenibacillus senegalensis TaxID=1465766 RepID=UPI00138AEF4F